MSAHVFKIAFEELHPHDALSETFQQFKELESLGVLSSENSLQNEFSESTESSDAHYQVRLPFKPNCN